MDERAEAVVLLLKAGHDLLDHFTIRKLNIGARRIDQKLLRQTPGKLMLVFEQQLFVLVNILKLSPVMGFASLFNVQAAVNRTTVRLRQFDDATGGSRGSSVELAITADGIELFQGKAGRVDMDMAHCARG